LLLGSCDFWDGQVDFAAAKSVYQDPNRRRELALLLEVEYTVPIEGEAFQHSSARCAQTSKFSCGRSAIQPRGAWAPAAAEFSSQPTLMTSQLAHVNCNALGASWADLLLGYEDQNLVARF
jgi:hypothetical protein